MAEPFDQVQENNGPARTAKERIMEDTDTGEVRVKQSPDKEPVKPVVIVQSEALELTLGLLEESITRLIEHISPVMSPQQEEHVPEEAPPVGVSKTAQLIAGWTSKAQKLAVVVMDADNRLEI